MRFFVVLDSISVEIYNLEIIGITLEAVIGFLKTHHRHTLRAKCFL